MQKLSEYVAKDIEGYEGLYAVTNCGKVYSHSKVVANGRLQKGRWIKPDLTAKGYYRVALFKNGVGTKFSVHRLVAKAFCKTDDMTLTVNHKDKIRTNNSYYNLEWCTIQYNVEHGIAKMHTFIKPDGTHIEVFNLRKWCRETSNIPSYSSLQQLASGNISSCKGWTLAN